MNDKPKTLAESLADAIIQTCKKYQIQDQTFYGQVAMYKAATSAVDEAFGAPFNEKGGDPR
jgi:hypothetical protein